MDSKKLGYREPVFWSEELLKKGIRIYFVLLIFEGALRKWLFPGFATPLLIIRDPVAIWIIFMSIQRGLLRVNVFLTGMVLIGLISIFTAIFLGHKNLAVAVYGARILVFHFPVIFVIGRVFYRDDVIELGRVTLLMAIPIAVLVAFQFYSPQSAWVNRGVGGDLQGAGFAGSGDYFRPPATFSFTTGTTQFYSFVACFIIYFWLNPNAIHKFFLMVATISLIVVVPLSISRSLFFQICISLVFGVIAMLQRPAHLGKLLIGGMIGAAVVFTLNHTVFFSTAVNAFTDRFETANEVEGGLGGVLGDRYLGGLIGAFSNTSALPFFGYGIGMGTNVGSMLLTGSNNFLISEGEWGRIIGEMGLLMGLVVILLRVFLTLKIALACFRKLILGDLLPWMLLSFGLTVLPQGGWSQPTSLGFCIVTGGLILASLRIKDHQASQR